MNSRIGAAAVRRVVVCGVAIAGLAIVAVNPPALAQGEPKLAPRPVAPPASGGGADGGKASAEAPAPRAEAEHGSQSLDRLYERLAAAGDEEEAAGIARLIERRWSRSGSPTADLLMARAVVAVAERDTALAVELLDRVVALSPNWAEAWNKRSTVFFMMGDNERAAADIQRALALDPRNYDAWAGLATLFREKDDDKHALEAYRHALAIHPFMPKVKDIADKLAPGVDGRDL